MGEQREQTRRTVFAAMVRRRVPQSRTWAGWAARGVAVAAALALVALVAGVSDAAGAGSAFLGGLSTISQVASTAPANGDVNPYGVAVVPASVGDLHRGDVLVSNFNDQGNAQGTGTTIVEVSPGGQVHVFATIDPLSPAGKACGGVGLTTALAVLRSGWVIVGSLPTTDGTAATATAGCLFVLNAQGEVVRVISGGVINGPWDMVAQDEGHVASLFVSNVLNGTVAAGGATVHQGTVVRVDLGFFGGWPFVLDEAVIGSGFPERTDPDALVIGPTGLGLSPSGRTLYVADTLNNRIAAISDPLLRFSSAGAGREVSTGGSLNGPLGLAVVHCGDIVTVNSGDGNAVEITPGGTQVATKLVDDTGTGAGTLFGLAVAPKGKGLYFVNDGNNMLDLLH